MEPISERKSESIISNFSCKWTELKFLIGLGHTSQEEILKSSETVEHLQRSGICMTRSLCLKCVTYITRMTGGIKCGRNSSQQCGNLSKTITQTQESQWTRNRVTTPKPPDKHILVKLLVKNLLFSHFIAILWDSHTMHFLS